MKPDLPEHVFLLLHLLPDGHWHCSDATLDAGKILAAEERVKSATRLGSSYGLPVVVAEARIGRVREVKR